MNTKNIDSQSESMLLSWAFKATGDKTAACAYNKQNIVDSIAVIVIIIMWTGI